MAEIPMARDLATALTFYARPEHWMALTDAPDSPRALLVAGSGPSRDGFDVAQAALRDHATLAALPVGALGAAVEMLRALEWVAIRGKGQARYCPSCWAFELDDHAPDCRLSAALAPARGEGEK